MKRTLSAFTVSLILLTRVAGQAIPAGEHAIQTNCSSSCTGALGNNIYPNGDFGSGIPNVLPVDPHLAPGYIYQFNPPPDDGFYCITNNTAPWGSFGALYWLGIEDNGPEPNGYMMVVNASYAPGLFFKQTVPVCENTVYEFSVDVINLFRSEFNTTILPDLTFLIDNVPYCSTGDIPLDETWHTERFSFTTATGQTSVTLAMRNNAPGGFGNDIALDNISFRACGPELLAPDTAWYCPGAPAQLQVHWANAPFADPHFQWQVFSNGVWEDVPGADSISLTVSNPQNGTRYQLLAASALANLQEESCRVVTQEIRLMASPAVQAQAAGTDIPCFGLANGSVQAQALAGAGPFAFLWNNGSSSGFQSGLNAGNYSVTITDHHGCSATAQTVVLEPPPLALGMVAHPVSCFGGSNGEAIATASGGAMPYVFHWTNSFSSDTITSLSAGSYFLTLTDAHGCTRLDSTVVSEPPALLLSGTAQAVNCFAGSDGEAMISVSGGVAPYTYLWNNGSLVAQNTGLDAGQYAVTVTDAQGCSTIESLVVDAPPALSSNVSTLPVSCFSGNDGSATVAANGGTAPYTFLWNTGQTGAQITGIGAASYSVLITDAHGCTVEAIAAVSQPAALEASVQTTPIACFGAQDATAVCTVSGGTGPYQYLWSQGQTTAQISGLHSGAYSVSVTDAQGCGVELALTIPQPAELQAAISGTNVSCFGGNDGSATITAGGGALPYSFLWNNGQTAPQIVELNAGTYSVTLTDAHGCSAIQQIEIQQPEILLVSGQAVDNQCFGGYLGQASVQATGGHQPYQYSWSTGQTTAQLNQLPAGNYSCTITDAHACSTTAAMSVHEPPLLTASLNATNVSCMGNADGSLMANFSGGTMPFSFMWNNGQPDSAIYHLGPGIYVLSVTDAHGCTVAAAAAVTEPALLAGEIQVQQVSCSGLSDAQISVDMSGGTKPYHYQWQNGLNSNVLSQIPAGVYSLNVTDAHGCSFSQSVTISEPPALTGQVQVQPVDCFGTATGSAFAIASGGTPPYEYLWQNGAKTAQIQGLTAGGYQLQITDAHHCTTNSQILIGEPPALHIQTQGIPVSCPEVADGTVSAMVSGGVGPYQYAWSNQAVAAQLQQLAAGSYSVTVTDANGCSRTAQQVVGVAVSPDVDLGLDQTISLGEEIQLTAHTNLPVHLIQSFDWSGDGGDLQCVACNRLQFVPLADGCERLTLHTIQGCAASDEVCYEVRANRHIYAPNVFLPNDNGENDHFTLFSDASVKEIRYLRIYDRWGSLVFRTEHIPTNDEPAGWDGTCRGDNMNPGVFAWVAQVEFIDGQVVLLKGDVTLLR